MTNDEVLLFKQFEVIKGEDDLEGGPQKYKAVFHSAFDDPSAPRKCQKR